MNRPVKPFATARVEALQALRRAASALRPHLETEAERRALLGIEEAIERFEHQSSDSDLAEFDRSRLDHLLALTGPDLAQELLSRLTEDLETVLETLELGAETSDWKRLRESTHVLISLAGSVGALSLQAMAEGLNAIAHRQDRAGVQGMVPPLTRELRALIALIRATPSPGGRR